MTAAIGLAALALAVFLLISGKVSDRRRDERFRRAWARDKARQ